MCLKNDCIANQWIWGRTVKSSYPIVQCSLVVQIAAHKANKKSKVLKLVLLLKYWWNSWKPFQNIDCLDSLI